MSPSVVRFHYAVREVGGAEVQNSRAGEPLTVLLGVGQLVPGVEAALAAMQPGERKEVVVPPEQGYGLRDPTRVQRVPRSRFPKSQRLAVGMSFSVATERGRIEGRVLKLGLSVVDVDFNHPLAGKALAFDLELLEQRAATREEIEHGHAHGPGGVEHA